jgi:hypothetical protein
MDLGSRPLSFIRHAFTAIGAGWALYGGAVRHDQLEALCGVVLALVGTGWGICDEWKAEQTLPKPAPKNEQNNYPQSLLIVALLTVSLLFAACAGDGSLATGNRPVDPAATIGKALPYIRTGATLAMGAGLKYGIDNDQDREAIANLSWSISHATCTLTDGKMPTMNKLKSYLLPANRHRFPAQLLS